MMARQYVGIENLNLSPKHKQILVDYLKGLGPAMHPSPAYLCHWRIRNDQKAALFEADFSLDTVTAAAIKNKLVQIFGVNPTGVTYTMQQTVYGPMATYAYGGINQLKVIVFGGADATWEESNQAVREYLTAYSAEWEEAV